MPLLLARAIALLLVLLQLAQVHGYADMQTCSGYGSWVRGAEYYLMNAPEYSHDENACIASLLNDTGNGYYTPGQVFTLHVAPRERMGIKSVIVGGGEFISLSPGGEYDKKYGPRCANYDMRTSSGTLEFRAPNVGGEITIKTICGRLDSMHVANDIVLKPGPGVQPPAAERSTDPAYAFQKVLHPKVAMLRYTKNATHLDVALEYNATGYVSFGVGRMMLQSVVLIGLNPDHNKGKSMNQPVGLYRLLKRKRLAVNEVVSRDLFEAAGITSASYEEAASGSKSVLRFTQLLSKRAENFTLSGGDNGVDVIWAVGPRLYGKHTACGTVLGMDFFTEEENAEEEDEEAQEEEEEEAQYDDEEKEAQEEEKEEDEAQEEEKEEEEPRQKKQYAVPATLAAAASIGMFAIVLAVSRKERRRRQQEQSELALKQTLIPLQHRNV